MRIFRPTALIAALCLLSTAVPAAALALPDMGGWRQGDTRSVSLDTVSGNWGSWQERTYTTPNGIYLRATLMEGKGPRFPFAPMNGVEGDEGPIGTGGAYESGTIGEYSYIYEYHPLLGHAFIVQMESSVLTIESGTTGTGRVGFISVAEELVKAVEQVPKQK